MKLETYRSPLNDLQPSGSYLKIERIQKNRENNKNRGKRKPQNREKKTKNNRRNKKEWGEALKKQKNLKEKLKSRY